MNILDFELKIYDFFLLFRLKTDFLWKRYKFRYLKKMESPPGVSTQFLGYSRVRLRGHIFWEDPFSSFVCCFSYLFFVFKDLQNISTCFLRSH